MKRYLCLLLFLYCIQPTLAQQLLRGKILAADNKTPVVAASVFLSNTSIGTISKEDGSFTISSFPSGRYDLVVSSLGYETYTISLQSNKLPSFLDISLKPKAKELEEVIVESYEKNGWEKWGNFFMENLIGKTPNSYDCKLLNKEAVRFRFSKKNNILKATSNEPLIIENEALGYTLQYDLTQFEFNFRTRVFFYQGYPLFKNMETDKPARMRRWQRNRYETYQGSLMHFMRAVFRNRISEEGFEVRRLIKPKTEGFRFGEDPDQKNILINQLLPGDSIAFAVDSITAGLKFNDYLQIVYPKKRMPSSYMTQFNIKGSALPMTAELWMPEPTSVVMVLSNGSYYYGKDLLALAYWAWSEKLSNMLPLEYKPLVK